MSTFIQFFRQEIPSDKLKLQELHQQYQWIPGEENIRPLPTQIQIKHEDLYDIETKWNSMNDYLYFKIFGFDFTVNKEEKFIVQIPPSVNLANLKRFMPNQFPYHDLQCYHYIMWYGIKERPYTSERITKDIEEALHRLVHRVHQSTFQFVWYENPKMTFPQLYHVHVFWIAHSK